MKKALRIVALSTFLILGVACQAATAPARNPQLPAVDFPSFEGTSAVLGCLAVTEDGRQIVVLRNGMSFVSMTDERFSADMPSGTVLGVAHVMPISTDPDRRPYLFFVGEGRGRPQVVGYRFR